jgi:DNA gyrase subunit A
VKKTSLNEFGNVRKGGIIAIGIDPGDALIEVKLTRGSIVENDEVKGPGRGHGADHQAA